jgi:phosphatidylserine/phosphatidylglycerophosphate/cardiolipin synthase-like enzyme
MADTHRPKQESKDRVTARAYTSPTLVLLAMDWPAGKAREDFLGFAILRSPGFQKGKQDAYLTNKIGFLPPLPDAQPLPSNLAPIQKFLWWDSAISAADRGKEFTYTVTPVCGTDPNNLSLQQGAALPIVVEVPDVDRNGISTWFNRAVVSSQAFSREFPDPEKNLDACMAWLANGLQDAFPEILQRSNQINGAIYHLTDNEWVMPALESFAGQLSVVYEWRNNDQTDGPAIKILKRRPKFRGFPRAKTNIMHDKFLVDQTNGRVLAGSANFTPEGLTCQANLLHIFDSPQLAELYTTRQKLLQPDPTVADTAKEGEWSEPVTVGSAEVRVFFSPESKQTRVSIDTVVKAVKAAKSSVIFCMFDPTDPALLESLLATGDHGKLLFGLLNSISDPNNKKTSQSDSGEPPKKPSPATQIKVTLFNRSRKDKKVIAYSYFAKGRAPVGFLPEFSTVNLNSKSILPSTTKGAKKRPPPAVHIHHKFIVVDADTDAPTIYTGSNNMSNNSTHNNDENLLEITGSPELAQTYFSEFMRLYEHYRARALWNMGQPKQKSASKRGAASASGKNVRTFTLSRTRDGWVRGAYKPGTPEFLARTKLAQTLGGKRP